MTSTTTGRIQRVAGPVIEITGLAGARLNDVVRVGPDALLGEVIRLDRERTVVQLYESSAGLAVGDTAETTGHPLLVELGPGLLGQVFDGILRPLELLARDGDDPHGRPFLPRGAEASSVPRHRRWAFEPLATVGDRLGPGDPLGKVREGGLDHLILVPPDRHGELTHLANGELTVTDPVAHLDGEPVTMLSRWPVRKARPFRKRHDPHVPMITGQRIIDTLFPLARGGAATIPGGFGTGKTVIEQSLAKWADADVVIYVGCGERGNELTEVLDEFPALDDPRTGRSLMERTILIANTSNMPVAAREASIYTGITLAEYYRDQGLHVAVLADSTSRWAEALREVSGRLEEMPGEEGYPAYLLSRLAGFYERAGLVTCSGRDARTGSVTIIGAVSPPGGDFSEPVTQYSLRLAGTFWALDTELARARHFPAIHYNRSYSLYDLSSSFAERLPADHAPMRAWASRLLQQEEELMGTVQLLGADALSDHERLVLRTGRSLREDFLQQSSFDPVDAYCSLDKQYWMLWAIHAVHHARLAALEAKHPLDDTTDRALDLDIARLRRHPDAEVPPIAQAIAQRASGEEAT
ncbi:MAG: V-type ATP synthase subunit A [Polyangiaceae bacterium]